MPQILLSTAYLPPAEYFYYISGAGSVLIEKEENYIKQTYRNRCYILSANGPQLLTVPVLKGNAFKTAIKDTRIDYTKRWQQLHIGAIRSSYGSSPFFVHYFEDIEKIINRNHLFLTDLNMELLQLMLKYFKMKNKVTYSESFLTAGTQENDFRYSISPKKKSSYSSKKYFQVFENINGFIPGLSIIDLLFNMGPDSGKYL